MNSFAKQQEDSAPKGFKLPAPRVLKHYGLNREQYAQLWVECDGRCPTCEKPFGAGPRTPCIDHDHRTYEVRGLICTSCNYLLGCLHDNAGWLKRAADYLTLPPTYGWATVPRVADAPPVSKEDG